MQTYQEAPDIRWDRVFAIIVIVGSLGGIGWLVWRVAASRSQGASHPVEFMALALLMGLLFYFAWLVLALSTVRYVLHDDRLVLRQVRQRAEVPLTGETHLYRWRQRWTWEGAVQRDLKVDALHLFPPFWLWREAEIWVLHCGGHAYAFRPSPQLLRQIKARVRHTGAQAG
ncbi:MAG: hypothetical protein K0R39_1180 [Symbiobacteriaceae bacterium]|jgi:hypothetical protein|nr:hypothetical protein [Symbiobacteriaceae bacterium]